MIFEKWEKLQGNKLGASIYIYKYTFISKVQWEKWTSYEKLLYFWHCHRNYHTNIHILMHILLIMHSPKIRHHQIHIYIYA